MVRILRQIALGLLVGSLAAALPPPTSPPGWLERFLAMDWREAAEFSTQLASGHTGHPAELSDPVAVAHSANAFEQTDNPIRHQRAYDYAPFLESRRPQTLSISSSSDDGQARHMALMQTNEPPAAQAQSIPAGPVASLSFPTQMTSDSLVEHSNLQGGAATTRRIGSGLTQALDRVHGSIPTIVRIPDDFNWVPSQDLVEELEEYVAGIDRRLLLEMHRLSPETDGDPIEKTTANMFQSSTHAFAVQLPSGLVFAKFYVGRQFVSRVPMTYTMIIWEIRDSSSPLVLRGIWGISSRLRLMLRDSLSVSSTRYVVTKKRDVSGKKETFLEQKRLLVDRD